MLTEGIPQHIGKIYGIRGTWQKFYSNTTVGRLQEVGKECTLWATRRKTEVKWR